ncbi:hypothetical protein ElyMa_004815400 [Elysia marginata]|uniref:Uncharacterized protein n=1 Tax=Elysia marginata TaxID=1093978 RepID=A0AAV4IQ74_9GAST|nr:hypothetical protein ElyMa_004815400 [Elysia marginata]
MSTAACNVHQGSTTQHWSALVIKDTLDNGQFSDHQGDKPGHRDLFIHNRVTLAENCPFLMSNLGMIAFLRAGGTPPKREIYRQLSAAPQYSLVWFFRKSASQ